MNDRFKFRYWHTKENKYIYTHCDCLAIENTVLYSLIGKPNKNGWFETDIEKAYNNFELIPEQCTGLKDKNGTLIYENDIVLGGTGFKYCIIWSEMELGWALQNLETKLCIAMNAFTPDEIEIIGNVHTRSEK